MAFDVAEFYTAPQNFPHIGFVRRQNNLTLLPADIPAGCEQIERSPGSRLLLVIPRQFQSGRKLLQHLFLRRGTQHNHRTDAQFSRIDYADCQILDLSGGMYLPVLLQPVYIEFLLKRNLSFEAADFSIALLTPVKNVKHQASFYPHRLVCRLHLVKPQFAIFFQNLHDVRPVVRDIIVIIQRDLADRRAILLYSMYLYFFEFQKNIPHIRIFETSYSNTGNIIPDTLC